MRHFENALYEQYRLEKKKNRKIYGIAGLLVLIAILLSFCFRTAEPGFIPIEACKNLYYAIRLAIAKVSNSPYALKETEVIVSLPYYLETVSRARQTLITCVSGMALALSGAIFQTVYKNPLASPNILGATVGVNMGNVILILQYSTTALLMPFTRYFYCFGCTICIVFLVLVLGRFAAGDRRQYSVTEMVMAGSILSQGCSVIVMYIVYSLEDNALVVYQELSMGTYITTDSKAIFVLIIIMIMALLPMIGLRFRFNAAGLDSEDALSCGVKTGILKSGGQLCGIILITAAMIYCGDIGLLSMAVPHLCRYLVGADFRKVSIISMCAGGCLLMVCKMISSMFYIAGTQLPINFIISLLILPLFMYVITKERRVFE